MPAKKNAQNKNPGTTIYLGPTIPGTLLQRHRVFRGELHSSILLLAEKVPAIKRLIVDVKEAANAEKKLGDRTSVLYNAFAEVTNHIKEVMKR